MNKHLVVRGRLCLSQLCVHSLLSVSVSVSVSSVSLFPISLSHLYIYKHTDTSLLTLSGWVPTPTRMKAALKKKTFVVLKEAF